MKFNFLFLLLLLACPVNATVLASMVNGVGGKIVLLDDKPNACKGSFAAYTTSPDKETDWGCWFMDEEFIHIKWIKLNEVHSYPIIDFTISEHLREETSSSKF